MHNPSLASCSETHGLFFVLPILSGEKRRLGSPPSPPEVDSVDLGLLARRPPPVGVNLSLPPPPIAMNRPPPGFVGSVLPRGPPPPPPPAGSLFPQRDIRERMEWEVKTAEFLAGKKSSRRRSRSRSPRERRHRERVRFVAKCDLSVPQLERCLGFGHNVLKRVSFRVHILEAGMVVRIQSRILHF